MDCVNCKSSSTKLMKATTTLGYKQFKCNKCGKQFNERSNSKLNYIEYPTEIVMLVVYHYYRFKLSLVDVVELMAIRGIHLSHQTVHNWVQTFGVELGIKLRKRRYKKCQDKWHIDATYLKIEGRWCYLYRAIDKDGNLVDVYLSDVRDQEAAEAFFTQAAKTSGVYPEQITTDKEAALYPAIDNVFGDYTTHRDCKFKNNLLEQDHRDIKSRTRVMKGFKNIFCALNFCTAFEEIRQFFKNKNNDRRITTSKIYEFGNLLKEAA